MNSFMKVCLNPQWAVIAAGIVIWFVAFPDDLVAVMSPVRQLLELVSEVLALTNSISPFAYGLAAVAVICMYWRMNRDSLAAKDSQT